MGCAPCEPTWCKHDMTQFRCHECGGCVECGCDCDHMNAVEAIGMDKAKADALASGERVIIWIPCGNPYSAETFPVAVCIPKSEMKS